MRQAAHSIFMLFGILIAGIVMFVVAVLFQITLMPDLTSAGLIWYYLIWLMLYMLLIIKITLQAFRRP